MAKADIAILTIIPEEYEAVLNRLAAAGCHLRPHTPPSGQSDQYGWVTGELTDGQGRTHHLVLALVGSPGPTQMAIAVNTTLWSCRPRDVLLVGIAGGFPLDGLARGDVAVSTVIYDYEYGKIADGYQPRHDNTFQVDDTLFSSAVAFQARDSRWNALDADLLQRAQ